MSKHIVVSDQDYKKILKLKKFLGKDTIKETVGWMIDQQDIHFKVTGSKPTIAIVDDIMELSEEIKSRHNKKVL